MTGFIEKKDLNIEIIQRFIIYVCCIIGVDEFYDHFLWK